VSEWHQRMRVEREPAVRRLNEEAAPATHALFGELFLSLKPSDMLNHRVAKDDIEAACLEIGGASVADDISSPRGFVLVFVHVNDGKLRALSYHGPIEGAATHIQHGHFVINGKAIRKQGHTAFAEVLQDWPIEGVNVHSLRFYRTTVPRI
jgi:hypothetical protein